VQPSRLRLLRVAPGTVAVAVRSAEAAEHLVVDQLGDRRMLAADDALRVAPENTVLEIGTGTGYQAAVLSRLAAHVYTVERHAALAATAEHVFQQLGYANIMVVVGDGSLGLPDRAPFDRIIVAAAAPAVPDPLLQQLGEGGRIIIPVGNPESQVLELVRKVQGEFITSRLEGVRFVPLIGQGGFSTRNF